MFTLNHISGGEATGSHVTGSDVTRNVLRMRNSFPRFSPTIMTRRKFPWVRACATGSCAISVLVESTPEVTL